jgi:hypothetical protein
MAEKSGKRGRRGMHLPLSLHLTEHQEGLKVYKHTPQERVVCRWWASKTLSKVYEHRGVGAPPSKVKGSFRAVLTTGTRTKGQTQGGSQKGAGSGAREGWKIG